MLFLVHTHDRPGALDVRMANREAHVAWLKAAGTSVKAAGPWLNEADEMAGSLLIIDAADRAALDAWLASDPYTTGDVWRDVTVLEVQTVFGAGKP